LGKIKKLTKAAGFTGNLFASGKIWKALELSLKRLLPKIPEAK